MSESDRMLDSPAAFRYDTFLPIMLEHFGGKPFIVTTVRHWRR